LVPHDVAKVHDAVFLILLLVYGDVVQFELDSGVGEMVVDFYIRASLFDWSTHDLS
jgi:hypothetical protein